MLTSAIDGHFCFVLSIRGKMLIFSELSPKNLRWNSIKYVNCHLIFCVLSYLLIFFSLSFSVAVSFYKISKKVNRFLCVAFECIFGAITWSFKEKKMKTQFTMKTFENKNHNINQYQYQLRAFSKSKKKSHLLFCVKWEQKKKQSWCHFWRCSNIHTSVVRCNLSPMHFICLLKGNKTSKYTIEIAIFHVQTIF